MAFKGLTTKQIRFCEILATESITDVDAYVKAGFSKSSAYKNASTLRKKKEISEYIKEINDKILEDAILSARERKKILSEMAKNDDVAPNDRRGAIDLLNRMEALYTQKIELSGEVSQNIKHSLRDFYEETNG